ncbi:MAG TPA: MBL fold metallo-hydrolase [Oscillospiraceae bacterium]|nr:MBL fold metallo-hydrolase [Oscillospiraceae bacterium]
MQTTIFKGVSILLIRSRETGSLGANCYLVACEQTRLGLLIDPGADAAQIIEMVQEAGITIKYIVNTHGHVDHVGANAAVREAFAAPIVIHTADSQLYRRPKESLTLFFGDAELAEADQLVQDGDQLQVGQLAVTVLATPGHTKGSICLLVGDALFSGDTLFAGSIGRTDFPGGSASEIITSIKEKLLVLPPTTKVYPGHGPQTTIGTEKAHNPFL